MKVLQLGKFYPIRGGVEKVMWDLAKGLNAAGVDCDMLCAMLPSDKVDAEDAGAVLSTNPTVMDMGGKGRCICVKALAKKAATMISPAMVRWLRRHKDEYGIIHLHHPDPMACLALRFSGYRGRVVLHWHSDIVKQKFFLRLYRPLQSWLIRRADVIVGTTPAYVGQSPFLAKAQDKIRVIPIGIRDDVRLPGAAPAGNAKLVFALGRLVPYKGFIHLIRAAELLPDDYRVVIGGTGPLMEELKEEVLRLGLEEKVRLAGYLSNEEVRRLFNDCTLFCLPSVMKTEAFGIVQIEAMSCGKPVVATRIPGSGVDWVNEDGVSGLNAVPEDAESLAAAIKGVADDPVKYETFCKGARARFESLFTLDTMINNARELYSGLYGNETE